MHSPRSHFSENGLGVFQLGVTPFAYNTRVDLKLSLFAILSLSNNFLLKFRLLFAWRNFTQHRLLLSSVRNPFVIHIVKKNNHFLDLLMADKNISEILLLSLESVCDKMNSWRFDTND